MVTKLHRRMGAMIRENVQAALPQNRAVRISAGWFSIGNILPDISWLPATHPHFFSRSAPYIFRKLFLSLEKHKSHSIDQFFISPFFSLRLGIVSHYLCDFFCAAHQGDGINGAKRHLNYEHEMRDFFKEHRAEIESLCRFMPEPVELPGEQAEAMSPDTLFSLFQEWHRGYECDQRRFLQNFGESETTLLERHSAYLLDIRTAVACCTCLICSFVTPVAVRVTIE